MSAPKSARPGLVILKDDRGLHTIKYQSSFWRASPRHVVLLHGCLGSHGGQPCARAPQGGAREELEKGLWW